MALFLISTGSPNYMFYSSELLPVFLICAGFYAITRPYPSPQVLIAAGIALGAVPFAKLQAAPVAVMMGGTLLYQVWSQGYQDRIARLLILVLGAIGPALLILLPLAVSGNLSEIWDGYLVWSVSFASERIGQSGGLSLWRLLQSDAQVNVYMAGLILFGGIGAVS
jgi:hypothetical protein